MDKLKGDICRILNQNAYDSNYQCYKIKAVDKDFEAPELLKNLFWRYQTSAFPIAVIDEPGNIWINIVYAQDIAWKYGYFITDRGSDPTGSDPMKKIMSLVVTEVNTKNTTWLCLDINIVGNYMLDLLDSAEYYKYKDRTTSSNKSMLANTLDQDHPDGFLKI